MAKWSASENDIRLAEELAVFSDDPYGYVMAAWPWGVPGTALEHKDGPDYWQREALEDIGSQIKLVNAGLQPNVRLAVASGHGVGKTALVSWLIHWFTALHPNPQCVVTANTQNQLSSKTWRELNKWNAIAVNGHWFEWTATRFTMREAPGTWFATAVPWSKNKSESFAGTHEEFVFILFDEASGIDDIIWEVCEGAMTTRGAMWVAFGNPTRNVGRFRQCWTKFRTRWHTMNVDSRRAKMADKQQIKAWLEDWGEDSDFFKVRVRGEFPGASSTQFISSDIVNKAVARSIDIKTIHPMTPKLMGVDVARQGDDMSVISLRQGRKLLKQIKLRIPDTMQLASRIAAEIREWNPDSVFVDGTGIGAGVFDRLVQLGFENVFEVHNGEKADDDKVWYNCRAEMYGRMREWLKTADIPDDRELYDDLTSVEFGSDDRERIKLEKKEDMKKRGLQSPDCADSLALTFRHLVPVKYDDHLHELEPDVI